MKVYLAATTAKFYVVENYIKSYLHANGVCIKDVDSLDLVPVEEIDDLVNVYNKIKKRLDNVYLLESFYYISPRQIKWLPAFNDFILDSGAFTFMANMRASVSWDDYIKRYADFIKTYGIELFFELDIDSIVGIKEVERLRDKLEILTNKKCIPVWHKSRGLDYWRNMISSYKYVAIGGIISNEITKKEWKYFIPLIEMAKKAQVQVHGLGFTYINHLKSYKFDSVDSSVWTLGNRHGYVEIFNGQTMIRHQAGFGKRIKAREVHSHNFNQWLKFQHYAEEYL